jgi:FKBP-type peptidyl-prolyl cis-trans isomerase SlpA
MSILQHLVVTETAYLTLHYRLASPDGVDIVSTFQDNPATLQLGMGQLSPALEALLIGLHEGDHRVFELAPDQAFGARNLDLLQRVSLEMLKEHSSAEAEYAIGDVVEFAAPNGGVFAGVLREMDSEGALFDFNHPLSGQPVKFEVKIIGIL